MIILMLRGWNLISTLIVCDLVGFVLCLVACVGLAFDPSQRIALWCGIPFVALCYGAWYLTRSRNMTQEPQHVAD